MWSIIEILVAVAVSITAMISAYHFSDTMQKDQMRNYYAEQLGQEWETFARALYQYVQDNQNSLSKGINYVTCSTLQSAGYLSSGFSCTDALGEQLKGAVAAPLGIIQTVVVFPSTPPSTNMFQKLGIQNPLSEKAFILKIGDYITNPEYSLASMDRNGNFQTIFGNSDNIYQYLTGQKGNGLVLPAAFNNNASSYPYVPVFFTTKNKGVGYWVWGAEETSSGVQFVNDGWQPACPEANGLPEQPVNSTWNFNVYNTSIWNYSVDLDDVMSGYICFPATQQTVDDNPNAYIPEISLNISNAYSWMEDQPDSSGNYLTSVWSDGLANDGYNAVVGADVVKIGNHTYTIFSIQNVDAEEYVPSQNTAYGLWGSNNRLMFVQGTPPSSWCVNLGLGIESGEPPYNYCYSVSQLLSEAGGGINYVTFNQ